MEETPGFAFHRDFKDGKISGLIRVSEIAVSFSSQKKSFSISTAGLKIKRGGAADRLIFFENPDVAGASIFTVDHGILDNPIFQNAPELKLQVDALKKKNLLSKALVISVLLFLASGIYILFESRSYLSLAVAKQIPMEWEKNFGDTVFTQYALSSEFIDDPQIKLAVRSLADPLLSSLDETGYEFKLHVIEDSSLNAFAFPGGNIVLHSGLILQADTPEEILGVLAHEISHVTRKHGLRGIIETVGLYALVDAVLGDASGIIAVIADNGAILLSQKYSRDFEREADDQGLDYLVAAKIDPRGMIQFFEKLMDETMDLPGGIAEATGFLSTHPASQERIETLNQKLKTMPRTRFARMRADLQNLKNMIQLKLSVKKSVSPEKRL